MASIINATTSTGLVSSADNSGSLQLATNNGTTAVTIDTSQNVGIGTSSPLAKLDVVSSSGTYRNRMRNSSASESFLLFQNSASGTNDNNGFLTGIGSDGVAYLYNYQNTALLFATNGSERMRITSDGTVLLGTTSTSAFDSGFRAYTTGQVGISRTDGGTPLLLNTTADTNIIDFRRSSTNVGTISVTTSSTSYNTSSDYRLKENVAPMTGALAKVAQLKPVTYTWKATGETSQGFIAHELQAVVPDCVTGEKDAVDEEGNPVHQGIDTSFLVATLTSAIQELKAELDATKAEVQALKGVA